MRSTKLLCLSLLLLATAISCGVPQGGTLEFYTDTLLVHEDAIDSLEEALYLRDTNAYVINLDEGFSFDEDSLCEHQELVIVYEVDSAIKEFLEQSQQVQQQLDSMEYKLQKIKEHVKK